MGMQNSHLRPSAFLVYLLTFITNRWWTWTSWATFQCYLLAVLQRVRANRDHRQLWERWWEGHELNVRKSESFQPPGFQVMACQISSVQCFGAQLELMSPPLCANKRQGRLMRRCSSCINASHAWMIILPIKSRAAQQTRCTQFLGDSSLLLGLWCQNNFSVSLMKRAKQLLSNWGFTAVLITERDRFERVWCVICSKYLFLDYYKKAHESNCSFTDYIFIIVLK